MGATEVPTRLRGHAEEKQTIPEETGAPSEAADACTEGAHKSGHGFTRALLRAEAMY